MPANVDVNHDSARLYKRSVCNDKTSIKPEGYLVFIPILDCHFKKTVISHVKQTRWILWIVPVGSAFVYLFMERKFQCRGNSLLTFCPSPFPLLSGKEQPCWNCSTGKQLLLWSGAGSHLPASQRCETEDRTCVLLPMSSHQLKSGQER